MELPHGSPWIHYTMESPWPLALIFLASGLIMLKVVRHRHSRLLKFSAIAIILLAPSVVVTAGLVETTAERLRRLTVEFVETALRGDRIGAGAFLTSDLTIVIGEDGTRWNKQKILDLIEPLPNMILSNRIRHTEAVLIDENKAVSILAQTTTPGSAVPISNQWCFRWIHDSVDGQWRIRQMIWEEWGMGQTPSARMIP